MNTQESVLPRVERANYSGTGSVAYLIEKPAPGVHEPRASVEVGVGSGFSGDHERKSFWKGSEIPGREVSAIAIEVLTAIGAGPDVTGDNLITRGIDLSALEPGDRLRVGEVILVRGPKPHRPCALFRERTGEAAYNLALSGERGALFVVEVPGRIALGDMVEVLPR